MRRSSLSFLICILLLVATSASSWAAKNVIVLVPDGCGVSTQTLARWYKGGELYVDKMVVGLAKTFMTNSVITDSAPAATAFATGYKTTDKFISVGPRGDNLLTGLPAVPPDLPYKPLATVLEGAKLMGKATGLVATSTISHATPASYGSHVPSRSQDNDITEQLVYQRIDVVFGGGKRHLLPTSDGGRRTDGENLLTELRNMGYQWVETRDQLMALTGGKAWGLFASGHMQPDINRAEFAPTEPSLAEMTAKAIELLSKDPDGFFLFVEASQVDWANHANDPIWTVTDFLAFDEAVGVALDFAKIHGDTLVLAYPDHNTGGIAIGNYRTDNTYTSLTIEQLLDPLKRMRITAEGVVAKIGADTSPQNIRAKLSEWWGIEASDQDLDQIAARRAEGYSLDYAIAEVISRNHTYIGFSTHGHNGDDVPLWAYGPGKPAGLLDNTQLAKVVADAMGLDMDSLNLRLFKDASKSFLFPFVDLTDPQNPVLRVGDASLPCNKNLLLIGQRVYELEGIVVYAPNTRKAYLPQQAINILSGLTSLPDVTADPDSIMPANECSATYNFATNTLSVPCYSYGSEMWWLEMQMTGFNPITFRLTGSGSK